MPRQPRIAPPDLIREDFRSLDARVTLGATWTLERALLQIAVASHAHEGHGAFEGRRFVDTTEDHVARALHFDAEGEKALRERWVDDVRDYAEDALAGRAPRFAVDRDGMPMFGIGIFRWIEVDPSDVLVGLVLGGLRDKPGYRRRARDTYGIEIGYGEAHRVDIDRMAAEGLTGEGLAHDEHGDRLDALRERGVILPDDAPVGGHVQTMYVRYQTGPGASDDTAVLAAGLLYGVGAAVGCYLADAIDTLEKYTATNASRDDEIARMIRARRPELGPTDEQAVHLTYLASTPTDMLDTLPDSTMRHFLQRDRMLDQSILESHFLYLMGRPWKRMRMGRYPLMDNEELYAYVEGRVEKSPAP